MNQKIRAEFSLITILAILFSTVYGQADLVITASNFEPASIDKGDIFLVQAQVTNIGNVASPANYMLIFYSQDLSIESDELVSSVSIRALAPNESQDINFIYPISNPLSSGDYYIGYYLDPFDNVVESDEDNLFCASNGTECATFYITNSEIGSQKFTYPILFVHGWTGSSKTWNVFTDEADSYYGWTYGGRLDYCLNPDDNQYTSDGYIQSFVNISDLGVGDYYYVNFDVSTDGDLFVGNDGIPFNDDHSNQSAIVKQGWAVKDAVEKVLNETGAEKVILVGHSMGGLACREYLQNASNWQADGNHHVAKLLTVGTPNGGSNFSGWGLGIFIGLDEQSEAVRDLRYLSTDYGGQYLDGGYESGWSNFYNDDVDCNEFIGDNIIGLNQKTSPHDVSYSCIVGIGNNFPSGYGDGIVEEEKSDLNNFLSSQPPLSNLHADRFDVVSSHTNIHKENHSTLIQGLDEPRFYDDSYLVPLNSLNFGYSTIQALNNPISPPNNEIDWDDFKIEITESGLLDVNVWNIPVHGFSLYLLDDDYNILKVVQAIGNSNIGFDYPVSAGTYFIECGSIPTETSWRYPYAYSILFAPGFGLEAHFTANTQEGCKPLVVNFSNESEGSSLTYSWVFSGGTPSSSNLENPSISYNQAGVFPVTLTISNANGSDTKTQNGYITVKSTPESDFTFSNIQNNTIAFTNQTQFDIEIPGYFWEFGDLETSTETSPQHIYSSDGVYSVRLTASNSCGSNLSTKPVDISTVGGEEIKTKSKISLFPNPADDRFTLKIEGRYSGEYRIALINSMGQIIRQENQMKQGELLECQIDISNLPSGTYFMQINSEKENQMKKLIKK